MKFVVFEKNYLFIFSQGPLLKHCHTSCWQHSMEIPVVWEYFRLII